MMGHVLEGVDVFLWEGALPCGRRQEAFILEGDVSLLQGHVFDGGGISL